MPPVGYEPTISAGKRAQTCALDRATTETGPISYICVANLRLIPRNFRFFCDLMCLIEVKVKVTLEEATKSQRAKRGIVLLLL
jgi:hypothetical protein